MILSAQSIRAAGVLHPCLEAARAHGVSHGLGHAGYDLRLDLGEMKSMSLQPGEFRLAATLERFEMPDNLLAIAHDKSTLARQGLSVFNTVIEPGWRGWLTLELVNHGPDTIHLHHGQGVAHVIFHMLDQPTERPYTGKYQDQESGPQKPRYE